MKNLIFLLLLSLVACQQQQSTKKKGKPLTPLSNWLINNEDSLFFQFNQQIKKGDFDEVTTNETIVSREFQFEDGYLGQLTNKIHDVVSCIQVYYQFIPQQRPSFQLLLSAGYDRSCVKAVDSLFNDIESLKHFKIVKYQPPGGAFSDFIVEKDTVKPEGLRFLPIKNKLFYDLDIIVPKKLSNITEEMLLAQIFGEEVQLKKINTVRFKVSQDTMSGSIKLNDIRKLFGVKD
jgi:hypothetical protein